MRSALPNLKERVKVEEEKLQCFLKLSNLADKRLNEGLKKMVIKRLRIPPEDEEPSKYIVDSLISNSIKGLSLIFPENEYLRIAADRMVEMDEDKRETDEIIRKAKEELIQEIPQLDTKSLFDCLADIYKSLNISSHPRELL